MRLSNKLGFINLPLIIILSVILIGTGYYLGKTSEKFTKTLPSQEILPPAPKQGPNLEEMKTEEERLEQEKNLLKTTQDLHIIASIVVDYALKNGYTNPIVKFRANDGIYARGDLGEMGSAGGAAWYATKIKGQWTVVHVGQAPPECSKIAQYNLPKSFLDCY